MFESRKDLTSKVASLEAQISEQEEQLTTALATVASREEELCQLREELSDLREANENGSAELSAARDRVASLEADLSAANEQLESFDEQVEAAANAMASQHLEALGHPPIDLQGSEDDPSHVEENPAQQLTKITDPAEAFTYVKANRENLLNQLFNR